MGGQLRSDWVGTLSGRPFRSGQRACRRPRTEPARTAESGVTDASAAEAGDKLMPPSASLSALTPGTATCGGGLASKLVVATTATLPDMANRTAAAPAAYLTGTTLPNIRILCPSYALLNNELARSVAEFALGSARGLERDEVPFNGGKCDRSRLHRERETSFEPCQFSGCFRAGIRGSLHDVDNSLP